MTFYAYVHARPETTDQSAIFYVGKGRKTRFKALPARNRYHAFVLDKHGAENILTGTMECSSDEIAFELEVGLIKCLRRSGVQLTNMTDGGDGTSGHLVTEEGLVRRSEQMRANWSDPVIRAQLTAAARQTGKNNWANPETRERMRKNMRGVPKTHSEEALESRRKNLEKGRSPEARAKIAETSRARWADPDYKARVSAKLRKVLNTVEKREAMSAAQIARNKRIRDLKGL